MKGGKAGSKKEIILKDRQTLELRKKMEHRELPVVNGSNGSSRPETLNSDKDKKDVVEQSTRSLFLLIYLIFTLFIVKIELKVVDLSIYCKYRKKTPPPKDKMDFDIEDFLKMDSNGFNGLGLGPGESDETSRGGSKSSRWFSKSQEEAQTNTAPVVPATDKGLHQSKQDAARSLLEMLQKGTQQPQDLHKILTAEELERSTGNSLKQI